MDSTEAPVVIVGAGFVGLFTALHLDHQKNIAPTIPVMLIDRKDHFCFKPLLYEYLTGEMESDQLIPSYRELLHGTDIQFIQDTVESIDLEQRQVRLAEQGIQPYSKLVLALGCIPAFFAPGAKENSFTFQSKADADALKQHLMNRMQQAVGIADAEERRRLLTVAIVGGGPAGVELALTVGDVLPQWQQTVQGDPKDLRIVLMNRGDILQGDVNSLLRDTAKKAMEERAVPIELRLEASVTAVQPGVVEYTRQDQPERLEAGTIVWTCGTQIHPLVQQLPIPPERRTRRGQLLTTATLQLLDYPDVFAAGDCADFVPTEPAAAPLPPTAQVAYQEGSAIAHAIKALGQGREPAPAKVTLRGTLMKLGYGIGVANLFNRYEISGRLGHLIRQLTYLELLPIPGRNLKETGDWLKETIFLRHAAEHHDLAYTAGYEPEELATLATAVMTSGTAVSLAELGVVSTLLETAALGKELAGAPSKYPNNRVIQALFGHQSKREKASQRLKEITITPENALDVAVDFIQRAIAILQQRATSHEIQEYKEFVYSCCNAIARAAGSGLLGTGKKVSSQEEAALSKLKAALSL